MRNIQIILGYQGSSYHGWQRQKNAITVQQKVEEALKEVTGQQLEIIGASRTDSGVHANGQSANFLTHSKIPVDKIPYAINSKLPRDIRVYQALERPMDFHSRYHSTGKKYTYHVINNAFGSALDFNRAWHVQKALNIEHMIKANQHFIGTHDFAAFRSTGSSVKTSERTIYASKLWQREEKLILEIKGNGFLYNMVRIIMGTLIEVGMGKISHKDIPAIIQSRERDRAGITAPAHGLYLEKVYYENP
ncbi:tRNA pseudouridine(38-40) synthase TruA [Irregularibacter muris]|uniref:tRNA pseudouridine synthase A n=1 Tax=Irregularibacter muris TaxID=1796619 RepID=A0AAE3L2J2_9FIRM|nr:tRNA pseudouridine(38-40) synthase TruA [Irregularibacter muris]MCR1898634.1 tRNA pseudouridine(38-40) synthase TruA [Irregularibacter muris]